MDYPISIKGVLLLEQQVVLVKNARNEWELPGGRVDPGESHAQTLVREFVEELDVKVAVSKPIDSYLFEVTPGRLVRIFTYGCTLEGPFSPRISDEHAAHCLWPVQRLADINLPEGYRRSVEKWISAG
jgi:8-oxo-dGTP pyrophosphatase MutT (NUDIX family)